jgi:hypothetical protein
MSARSLPVGVSSSPPQRPGPELVPGRRFQPDSAITLRIGFWVFGSVLAAAQAWVFRYQVTADSISYLDVSDGVMPGADWHGLINGVWSPLYPFLLGVFRRTFKISPASEIVAGHLLNVAIFLFAYFCFELLLRVAINKLTLSDEGSGQDQARVFLPQWAYLTLGYALFLSASILGISVKYLRADMLMSAFVYLAVAMLLHIQGRAGRWRNYAALGVVLGVGYLAKAPFLVIGLLILAAALFSAKNWRLALKMAASAFTIFLLIGSLYFVPLSLARGYFTLGESGRFNYLIHVNRVYPEWYMQNVGGAHGSFAHPVEKVFSSPPAYGFSWPSLVTHPLRIDPSYWVAGVRPKFVAKGQIAACLPSLRNLLELQAQMVLVPIAALALAFISRRTGWILRLKSTWPMWATGLVGCALYVPVHLETRYVAEFLALFWFGIVLAFRGPLPISRMVVRVGTILVAASLLLPLTVSAGQLFTSVSEPNADAEAAAKLADLGIRPGVKVARVSSFGSDLGIERLARVEIIGEVDVQHAKEFWMAPLRTQTSLLNLFASRGAQAVIATLPQPGVGSSSGWRHLGSTRYWVWLPEQNHGDTTRR